MVASPTFHMITPPGLSTRVSDLATRLNTSWSHLLLSLYVRRSSYGGDVYAMLGLVDYIRGLDVKVNTHCIGTCMSAASVLLSCGTGERTMTKHGTVMVHEGSAFEAGKTTDVMKGVDHLKDLQKDINEILGEVTKKDARFWELSGRNDSYFDAEQCLEYGIVDKIV